MAATPSPNIAAIVTGGDAEAGPTTPPAPAPKSVAEATQINPENYKGDAIRKIFFLVIGIFITMAAYYAMVLTNWATLQSDSTQSNPKTGSVALWLQATGEFIALILYIWSLVAPKLFPDRDFSPVVSDEVHLNT